MEGMNYDNSFDRESGIAAHEISPADRNQNQMKLATDLFEHFGNAVHLDSNEGHNDIMFFWVDKGFSKAYREIEDSDEFKYHPRLNGDIFKITAEDVIHYVETGSLPE